MCEVGSISEEAQCLLGFILQGVDEVFVHDIELCADLHLLRNFGLRQVSFVRTFIQYLSGVSTDGFNTLGLSSYYLVKKLTVSLQLLRLERRKLLSRSLFIPFSPCLDRSYLEHNCRLQVSLS